MDYRYKRRIGAFLSTAALIAAMSPVAAFAKTSGTDVADSQITITGLNSGDTVTAYQVFDADIDGSNNLTYTAATGLPEAYNSVDKLSALKNDAEKKSAGDAYSQAFTKGEGAATPANGHKVTGTAGADGNAKLTLDSGYWVVVVTTTSGKTKVYQPTTIDASPVAGTDGKYSAKKLENQDIKNEPVTLTKGVGADYKPETDKYTVGQSVPFRVTTNVPNYPADSKDATFKITDKPTAGLEIVTKDITVKVGTTTVWENSAATTGNETAFKTAPALAANGYTFDFAKEFVLKHPGQAVEVIYNAKLTSAAFSRSDTDVTGNTARVEFNPNPYSDSTVKPDTTTKVHTYGYVFPKTDKGGKALEGAVFTLYDKEGKEVKNEKGQVITSTSTKVGDKAYVYFEDLGAGSYTAKETTVPAGKQKAQDVTFNVNKENAKADNPATTEKENNYLVSNSNVVDPDQPALPVTGDVGTALLTIGGVALLGAACLVASRSLKHSK